MRLPGAANISENSPTHLLWGQSPNLFYLLVNKHENGKPFFGNRFLVKILPCCIAIRVWINIPTPRNHRVQYSILYCCYIPSWGDVSIWAYMRCCCATPLCQFMLVDNYNTLMCIPILWLIHFDSPSTRYQRLCPQDSHYTHNCHFMRKAMHTFIHAYMD